jgi:hypothetical protein
MEIRHNLLWISQKLWRYSVKCVLTVKLNSEIHERCKHIDVEDHFLRDLHNKGEINVTYVKSEEQLAATFRKVLLNPSFEYLRQKLGTPHTTSRCTITCVNKMPGQLYIRIYRSHIQNECPIMEGNPFMAKYTADISQHSEEQQTMHLGFERIGKIET